MVKCWAETYCKQRCEDNCHEVCLGYVMLEALYTQSRMPKVYQYPQKLIIEKADTVPYIGMKGYIENVVERVEEGSGIYLFGKQTGTGKTSLACAVMNAYFRKKAFFSNLDVMGVYIHTPTFLEDYRKSYHDDDKREEFDALIEDINEARLVIFDDIGAEKPSDWVRERLLAIIDKRVGDGKANIFTSNLSIQALGSPEVLGARVASRIAGATRNMQLEFKGADKRQVTL